MIEQIKKVDSSDQSQQPRMSSKDKRAHVMKFLARQNGDAWLQDEKHAVNREKILDIILSIHKRSKLSATGVKTWGKDLTKLFKATGGRMKLSAAIDLVAKALGYRNYVQAFELRGEDNFVPNLWKADGPEGRNQTNFLAGGWPSEKPSEELKQRRAFNRMRAGAPEED
ncbi:hypothetical protein [Pseudomonas putida]|uniref:Uncharacterized protein n=1 Tax=Pseudomonas putida TaxID=303 RepID=A0AAW5HMC7_PSEPU|nr:hypothetical protein [Pseudomonas putida]MCO1623296.1 hypothetical protein [Pseudomonas putida]